MIEEILFIVALMTPIAERLVELVKDYLPSLDRRIIATFAGLVVAPLVWLLNGEVSLWSCLIAGGLISLPSGLLHDLLELFKGVKDNTRNKIVFGKRK